MISAQDAMLVRELGERIGYDKLIQVAEEILKQRAEWPSVAQSQGPSA